MTPTTTTAVICILMTLLAISQSIQQQQQMDADGKEIGSKVLSRKKRFLIFPTGSSFSIAVCSTIGVYGNPQFSIFSWGLNYGFAYNLPTNSTLYTNIPPDIRIYPFYDPDATDPPPETTEAPETTTNGTDSSKDSHEDSHETHDNATDSSEMMSNRRRQYHVYSRPQYETQPMMHRRYRRDMYRNVEAVIDKMGFNGRECILQALCESSQIFDKRRRTMVQELIRTVFSMPKSNVLPFEHSDLMIYDKAYRSGQRKAANCEMSHHKCGFSLIKLILGKYSKPSSPYIFM